VSRLVLLGALVLLLVACAGASHRQSQPPAVAAPTANPAGSNSVEGYVAAIKAASQRSDHESDSKTRADLATAATRDADACLAADPEAAGCHYGKALAIGLEARAHPTRAVGLLSSMLQSLGKAESADPSYDQAGPLRVRALVLIRAPGWPVGPGDADAGLAAAQHAVALQPTYPPNVLALAEGRTKTGDALGARESYARARDLIQALPSGAEREEWLHDAEEGLRSSP
jgi:hypothetical protein